MTTRAYIYRQENDHRYYISHFEPISKEKFSKMKPIWIAIKDKASCWVYEDAFKIRPHYSGRKKYQRTKLEIIESED